jgi:hypothetical protein
MVAVAFRADVAHRGETGLERDARIAGPAKSRTGNRNGESPGSNILRITGQVSMRVGQAGQNRGVGEIHQAVIGRTFGLRKRTDTRNLVTVDHDGLVGESLSGAHIEQLPGVDENSAGGLGGGSLGGRKNA